jgi:pyruvate dehydrogenase E2 component (dihydrolipoamide acetyltransferase)
MPLEIIMPKFGFTLETGEIIEWLKREGDAVESGEPICEVTTDKVNMEIEAPADGTLYKILFDEGDTVEVTTVIAYMLSPGEAPPESLPTQPARQSDVGAEPIKQAPDAQPDVTATPVARRLAASEQVDLSRVEGTGHRQRITRQDVERTLTQPPQKVVASPAARRIAGQAGIDLRVIQDAGTGPGGRIQGDDVQAYLAKAQAKPSAPTEQPGDYEVVRLKGMRRAIATRMQESYQTAPHFVVEVQVDATEIEALRQRLKTRGDRLSVTALLVKACASVLRRHPHVNATWANDEIWQWATAHIGVAVALDAGLVVPVIHHAERLSLQELQAAVTDLAEKARANQLRPEHVSGGTFTISNLGMHGVTRFTAIINPPQVAILAVGRTMQQFLPDADGKPALRSTINLALSADHRVIDGAQAAHFLNDLQSILEDPALLAW